MFTSPLPQSKEINLGTRRSGNLDYNNPSSPNPLKSDFSNIAVLRPEQKYLFHISPNKKMTTSGIQGAQAEARENC